MDSLLVSFPQKLIQKVHSNLFSVKYLLFIGFLFPQKQHVSNLVLIVEKNHQQYFPGSRIHWNEERGILILHIIKFLTFHQCILIICRLLSKRERSNMSHQKIALLSLNHHNWSMSTTESQSHRIVNGSLLDKRFHVLRFHHPRVME